MAASKSTNSVSWWTALAFDPLPIGGVAVALLLGTNALLGIPPSLPLLVAGFCGAALVYGADRALVPSPEDATNHPERIRWVRSHRKWLIGEAGGLLIVGGYALSFLRQDTLHAVLGLSGVAGLHLLPLGACGRPLKALGLAKPLIVAGTWAVGAVLLPVLEAGHAPTPATWGVVGYRLLFLLPNVWMAEWGDRRGDRAAGVASKVGALSGGRVRGAATGLLGLAAGGAAVGSLFLPVPLLLGIDAGGALLLMVGVWTLSPERPGDRLLLDALVAWPLMTALVAWGLGVFG